MSATIQLFEGFVEKFVGDAVMAVFGAPVAHDEDPERAVRAALVLQQRVAALSVNWLRRIGQPLSLHIGINTGPVVAGQMGSNRDSAYAVTGDTVNLAARLQSTAGPGQILVSHSTYLLTQHAFRFEALGAVSLKGKAEPIAAYRVNDTLSVPRSTRGLQAHGLAAPLVGREQELSELRAAFGRMLTKRTQLITIVGEGGAGKTRLLSEFLGQLREAGNLTSVTVRRAACSPVGKSTYGVPAALLRDAYGLAPDDSPSTARQKIAAALAALGADEQETQRVSAFLGYVLGVETDESRTRHLEPEQLKQQIFFAAQAVIERRLEHSPLLLIIEDLHWTDSASVELLRFLIDRLTDRQFMLIASHRPAPNLSELTTGQTAHTLLRLGPLSTHSSESLLAAFFGSSTQSLPDDLRIRIVENAGGNPLFLEEMVRGMIADGVLVQQDHEWKYRPLATVVHVPLTIHGLLLARLDRLPGHARHALQEASVIGPLFADQLLRQVATNPASLDEALDVLVETGLVSEVLQAHAAGSISSKAPRQYRFCHGLFHEVSYQNLLGRRRTELHGRIGDVLEGLFGREPQRVEELETLGHHFRLSSDKAKGAHYLTLAGDWARSIYANADAIRHYTLALETLNGSVGRDMEQLAVRERLADVLAPVGERSAAMLHLAAAREGYSRAGDRFAEARALRKTAALHWAAGERTEAKRCVQEGLALIGDGADHIEQAHLCQEMGQLEYRNADNESALEWTQRALSHVERLAAVNVTATAQERGAVAGALALALNTKGVALARLNRFDEAVIQLERSVTVAREHDLPQAECRGLANLGVLYSSANPQRAIEACEGGLETAKRIGDLGLQSKLYTNLAVAYCTLTNRCEDRGIGAARTAIEIDRSVGQLDQLTVSLIVLAQIYQCHGEPARALGYYEEALALAEQTREPQLIFPCYDGLATLYLDLDDQSRAERYMRMAQDTCERAGLSPDALVALPFLA